MPSLIHFHRVLIAFAIFFCLGYAGWEITSFWVRGGAGRLAIGILFVVFAVLLGLYLRRLTTFLGYDEGESGEG